MGLRLSPLESVGSHSGDIVLAPINPPSDTTITYLADLAFRGHQRVAVAVRDTEDHTYIDVGQPGTIEAVTDSADEVEQENRRAGASPTPDRLLRPLVRKRFTFFPVIPPPEREAVVREALLSAFSPDPPAATA
jgi:hypothetical protein